MTPLPTERNGSRAIGLGSLHFVSPFLSRDPKTAVSVAYSPCTAVVHQVEVAVLELGHAGGVLVGAGRYFGAEDAGDREVACPGWGEDREDHRRTKDGSNHFRLHARVNGGKRRRSRELNEVMAIILGLEANRRQGSRIVATVNEEAETALRDGRRRLMRFSVRGMIVLVLVIGAGVGWFVRRAAFSAMQSRRSTTRPWRGRLRSLL